MQQALLILPVVVPVVFWAVYHYHKDRHLPEPPRNLLLCFCLGLFAAGFAKLSYIGLAPMGLRYDAVALGLDNPWGLLAYATLVIGPVEEFAKLLPFVLLVIRLKAFDEPLDGIIYASFIGLGFAAAENVYFLEYLSPIESIARGFAGPVVHIIFASIWAHWITRARLSGRSIVLPAFCGFAIAALLHGLYDFLVLLRPAFALPVAAALIVSIWVWRLILMRRLHRAAVRNSPVN